MSPAASRAVPDLSLYLVTDPVMCAERGVAATAAAAARGGATTVQLRHPQAAGRALLDGARALMEAVAPWPVPCVVDDRLDVAMAAGAAGVHLGQTDLPAPAARRLAGPGLVIGWSVWSVEEAEEASSWPPGTVDYLGVGSVFPTATKATGRPPLGLDGLATVVRSTGLPCVAIGGIDEANAGAVMATGVAGVAVVSAICAAGDPEAATRRLRAAIEAPRRR
jgi:thiamine-phosphate pyrophosphorylase